MIKKSIFTLFLMAVISCVSAQSLRFELNGTIYSEGEVIECATPNEWGEYLQEMQLRNVSSDDMNVIVKKEVIENLEGVMNYFCWGMCFGPDTYVSPNPVAVPANSITEVGALSFHAMFDDGVFGKIQVKYSAYDERHPDDAVTINVVFHKSGVGVVENSRPMTMGKAFPNPASSVVHFNYSFDGNLSAVVYNLLGQEVMRQELNANDGQMNISVAGLQDGIYFCTMMVDGRACTTQKFVVKK